MLTMIKAVKLPVLRYCLNSVSHDCGNAENPFTRIILHTKMKIMRMVGYHVRVNELIKVWTFIQGYLVSFFTLLILYSV